MAELWAPSADDVPIVAGATTTPSLFQRALRRAKGQIEKSLIESNLKQCYQSESSRTSSTSTENLITGDLKQAVGTVYGTVGFIRNDAPIPEYEGRHRWDPYAEWSAAEEKKLVRRLDYKICSWVCFMFFALQLDRGNIVQALSDNMLADLGLNTNQYNYGMAIFYISFLSAELPSQLISKKLGPDNWIPIQMVAWSIVAIFQCRITGESTYYLTRALLGLIEGGFIPTVILYLSYFYTSKELPIRLSFFWGAQILTSVVSAFLAFGILHLRQITGWAGWRWLFAIEGTLTVMIGMISWFYLPPSPTQSRSKFRGEDGWFSEREEIIMVNRILRDDPGKGGMHNRQGLSFKYLWAAFTDYDMWPIYLLGLTWGIPNHPIAAYLTLTLKSLGWDTFQTNLLTIPAYILLFFQLIFWTWVSEKINNRFLIVLFCQIYMLPLLVALEVLPASANPWFRYALSVLMVGYPYIHAIIVAITSRNAGSVRTRTVGSAIYNMCVQASNVISANIYQDDDKPLYRRGNKILLGFLAWNFFFIIFIKYYYIWKNASRKKKWNAMTPDERVNYLATTNDEGNKRLDFRFAH